ncbi:MAG: mannitol dehydrogenase family protein [Streptomyces sp.]|uniref:mannitol dehydrogenase family protein n=1 Tax=Streptomyces sp. TaxID=1931 RepID=UPI003D6A547A
MIENDNGAADSGRARPTDDGTGTSKERTAVTPTPDGAAVLRPTRPRLDAGSAGALAPGVRPMAGGRGSSTGIVHIGLGAFHRAHQAVYTEAAMAASGDTSWGILGVNLRSSAVVEELRRQDCLYTVLERDRDAARPRVVGSLRAAAHLPSEPGLVLDAIAAPSTRIVTVTVTEKGYRTGAGRRLRIDDEVRADVEDAAAWAGGAANSRPPRTLPGLLLRGLQRRLAAGGAPLALASCDNIPASGKMLRALLEDCCDLLPAAHSRPLLEYLDSAVGFPSSVVDRIVPATTDADLAEVAAALGAEDRAAVVAEPFSQWVVSDDFPAGRPDWESAGVTFTDDVAPYEQAKLRMLNASHSTLAYLGGLAGHDSIAGAVADPLLAEAARRLLAVDVIPVLTAPGGVNLDDYAATVLRRFANPALRHRTAQVAADGSQKVPIRLLGTVREQLEAGRTPEWAVLAVAAWLRYTVVGTSDDGRTLPVQDPLAERLRAAAGPDGAEGSGSGLVSRLDAVLRATDVFGEELREDPSFRALLGEDLRLLAAHGVTGTLRRIL